MLVATILGSSMAFIDSTVVNVALPAVQANFQASVVDMQWVIESYGLFLSALILVGRVTWRLVRAPSDVRSRYSDLRRGFGGLRSRFEHS